ARDEGIDHDAARRLAHVVRVGLERETPDGEAAPGEIRAETLHHLRAEDLLLPLVRIARRADDLEVDAVLLAGMQQRAHILREAGAAEPRPRIEEAVADARIRPDAHAHVL